MAMSRWAVGDVLSLGNRPPIEVTKLLKAGYRYRIFTMGEMTPAGRPNDFDSTHKLHGDPMLEHGWVRIKNPRRPNLAGGPPTTPDEVFAGAHAARSAHSVDACRTTPNPGLEFLSKDSSGH